MKALWQDPEYRAKMAARDAKMRELHKTHPEKFSRYRVPDGMTREMAKPLWDRAYELADKFIQILKDTGQL
jgi:hypothetical protein